MNIEKHLFISFLSVCILFIPGLCFSQHTPRADNSGGSYYLPDILPDRLHLEVDPEFSWRLYYEDNISGSGSDSDLEDFSNRYKPKVDIKLDTTFLSLTGSSEIEVIEYIDEKEWNTVDQDHELTLKYKPSPRAEVFIGGSYSVETDPDRYFEDDGSLGGGFLVRRNKNKTKYFSSGFDYSLSARSSINGFCSFSNFETGVTDDSDFYTASVSYLYSLSKTTTLDITGFYSLFDYTFGGDAQDGDTEFLEDLVAGVDSFELFFDSDYELENYNIAGGLKHSFSDDCTLNFNLGWRYTKNDSTNKTVDPATGETITENDTSSGDGFTFNIDFEKKFADTRLKIRLNQNVGNSPNTGASYENLRLIVSLSQAFTERFKSAVSLQYNKQDTEKGDEFGRGIDRDSYYASAGITYQLNKICTLGLRYNYSKTKNDISGSDSDRNTVYFSVTLIPQRPYTIW